MHFQLICRKNGDFVSPLLEELGHHINAGKNKMQTLFLSTKFSLTQ